MNFSDLFKFGLAKSAIDAGGNVVGMAGADGRIYQGNKTGLATMQRLSGANPATGTGAGTGNGFISDTQRTANGPFFGARLVFANYDTTAVMTINKAAAVATGTVGQGLGAGVGFTTLTCYKNGLAGNSLTGWVPVTFNGGAVGATVPVATAGPGGTGNGIHLQPGILLSDFFAVSSVPRVDGSPLPMLRTRVHLNDNSFAPNLADTSVQSLNAIVNAPITGGHLLLSNTGADIPANLLTNTMIPFYFGGVMEPVGIIFYSNAPSRTIGAFGDSLTQGVKSTGDLNGWPSRLNAKYGALGTGLSINAANWGVSGQRLENSLAICRAYCAQYKPHYASIFAWSPNNTIGGSQAVMDALWANVLYTIDYLLQLGVTPIVFTSGPVNYLGGGDEVLWRAQNARVLTLPSSVVKIDAAAILTQAGTYNSTAPKISLQYGTGVDGVTYIDGTHYNDAGYAAIADLVRAAIK